ncbi:MAG TPA: glycoside hydrolase family 3 protein [Thermoanaerobaculia bacterium]|jgi:beta-glucosidase-like glycosyl hydrolase
MNLDEKIGRLFVIPAHGRFLNERSRAYRELVRHVTENHAGGVIWFASGIFETAFLNARLQSLAKRPLLISADLESGLGMRFPDATWWPPAMAVSDLGLIEEQGRITAIEAQAVGIQQILAPVADVNVDRDNPVINTRSYGDDPYEVARRITAFIDGVQNAGALATAKHFPGHGDTRVDSHRALPLLDVDRDRLERVELVPFRAAIEANVASIMIGHLAVPSLDPTPAPVRTHFENAYGTHREEVPRSATIPATLSQPIVTGLLRRELGYDGLVITDAMDMGGLAAHFEPGEAAVRAIEAGNDQILYSADTDAAMAAVRHAVRSGRIAEARIDESFERIDRIAAVRGASFEEISRIVDRPEHVAVAEEIARRAVRVVRDERGLLPLRTRPTAVIVSDWPEENQLVEAVRLLDPREVFTIDSRSREQEIEGDVIVMLLALRPRSGAGRIAMPMDARRLADRHGRRMIAISFGSPYVVHALESVSTYVDAYGIQPVMQRAAVSVVRAGS